MHHTRHRRHRRLALLTRLLSPSLSSIGRYGEQGGLMDRRGKPKKAKAEAKRPLVRKPPKDPAGKVRDLEKRVAETLKLKAEALGQLQTRDRELVEAQEQQTATSEILNAIASSPTDTKPVFDAIVTSAARLCR